MTKTRTSKRALFQLLCDIFKKKEIKGAPLEERTENLGLAGGLLSMTPASVI